MKKNLLDPRSAQAICDRLNKLTPEHKNLWGRMNPTEMLLHCNLCNTQLLEEKYAAKMPTAKQTFMKVLGLYLKPTFPKNLKGAARNDTSGKVLSIEFNEQLMLCKATINRFPIHNTPMTLEHPVFGPLSNREWGIAAWKHMDHHLRQFGV